MGIVPIGGLIHTGAVIGARIGLIRLILLGILVEDMVAGDDFVDSDVPYPC